MNRTRITTLGWRAAAVLAAAAGLAACADVPPPTAQLGASAQAVQTAERAGALQYAPAEYQSAREKLGAADTAMRNDDRTKARRLAEEAQVEADLATIRSQRATAQQAAGAVRTLAAPRTTNTGAMPPAAAPALPPATSGTSDWSVPRTPGGMP
ncbi:DUF4398 domain-containing protein [Azospirillum canadense]|uniref:DUF4398 domain-containing protein n=1 Tax=Azospirillum canadense TaxID=403962 RepID=UPI0022267BD4|nr:DUF4398 domain-containing protein [Azospirillum canadense]MCW2235734.1 hypothetical protein [Azospirillum canadense]